MISFTFQYFQAASTRLARSTGRGGASYVVAGQAQAVGLDVTVTMHDTAIADISNVARPAPATGYLAGPDERRVRQPTQC